MNVIENFAELSFEEQMKFAEALINTINSENTFIDNNDFTIYGIDDSAITGELIIELELADTIEVSREATWTCSSKAEMQHDPGYDASFANLLFEDAKKAFKTLSTVIDGYKVSLVMHEVDEEETIEVEVDNYSEEDAGIGGYEYWGHTGYDSQPYIEVEGTIVKACTCYPILQVELAEASV
jgi:hypothetical protein